MAVIRFNRLRHPCGAKCSQSAAGDAGLPIIVQRAVCAAFGAKNNDSAAGNGYVAVAVNAVSAGDGGVFSDAGLHDQSAAADVEEGVVLWNTDSHSHAASRLRRLGLSLCLPGGVCRLTAGLSGGVACLTAGLLSGVCCFTVGLSGAGLGLCGLSGLGLSGLSGFGGCSCFL